MQHQQATTTSTRKSFLLAKSVCFALLITCCLLACLVGQASAGGKGGKGKGGQEDIIMYNGNIVLRGDKEGGSIVMAGNQPSREDVEFMPNFFDFGEMGRR